jgi:hypothetical protein
VFSTAFWAATDRQSAVLIGLFGSLATSAEVLALYRGYKAALAALAEADGKDEEP